MFYTSTDDKRFYRVFKFACHCFSFLTFLFEVCHFYIFYMTLISRISINSLKYYIVLCATTWHFVIWHKTCLNATKFNTIWWESNKGFLFVALSTSSYITSQKQYICTLLCIDCVKNKTLDRVERRPDCTNREKIASSTADSLRYSWCIPLSWLRISNDASMRNCPFNRVGLLATWRRK